MANIRTKYQHRLSRMVSAALATLSIVCLPLTVSMAAQAAECTAPPDPGPGIHHPVGADASQYIYNCGSSLWVSPHFTYDPTTGETTPSDPTVYTYNPKTGAYDYDIWYYNAPGGSYATLTKSTATPPAGARVVGAPVPVTTGGGTGSTISNTGNGSNNTVSNNGGVTGGSSIDNTGPNSNNTVGGTGTTTVNGINGTTATADNKLTAQAATGNAMVLSNTGAGGAGSGDAQDIANVMNLLQSSSNALSGNMLTFVANINGDVTGDLTLDPNALGAVQPAALNTLGTTTTTLNNTTNATMNNDITLGANSGNATVANNTSGGDATTGSAKTIANVVNLINSAISSGRSFIGVVNINGNLNGDILLPPDFVNQLLAANVPRVDIITGTGPSSNNAINNNTGSNNTTVTNTNNQGINNNVNATATAGAADVSNNTTAGNATSGNATTHITAFNLTGSQIVGSNALLVFVNVLGQWVGLIVNAPPGATAAGLGGGIVSNTGPSSNNAINGQSNNNTDINNTANQRINNNITLASRSGNAGVNGNTTGGNARSGDASAAVNLLNVQNSSLSLANWFGILFINVFGTWHGSFGVNTSAGDPVYAGVANTGGAGPTTMPVFQFVPSSGGAGSGASSSYQIKPFISGSGGTNSAGSNTTASAVLAADTGSGSGGHKSPATSSPLGNDFNWWLIPASGSIFFIWMAGEKIFEAASTRRRAGTSLVASLRHFLF